MFRQFEKTSGDSPFPLVLSTSGDDFAVMGMHFKLGLYEHQSAGALQGMIDLMRKHPEILENPALIKGIKIVAYEPAFGIIGDPAKRDPKTRQSADHSMVYIVGTLLRKAVEKAAEMGVAAGRGDFGLTVLEYSGGTVVVSSVSPEAFLLVLLRPEANLAALLYDLRRFRAQIASLV
jgi:2-methylcitrate dehydratase